jgi:hypothetical protein
MTFISEPLAIAERSYRNSRRSFLDFEQFMSPTGRYDQHCLIMGSNMTAFDQCHHTSLCDFSHSPYPIHGLVRPYLAEIARAQGSEIPQVYDNQLLLRSAPLYFQRPIEGELAVVDLDAAFWQLYKVASLDLTYDGVGYPTNGRVRFLGSDELHPHKLLRNAVIGTCRAEVQTVLDHGKARLQPINGKWRRPALWAWVMDTLEAVAWDMRSLFGAVHIQIDGYILPHADLAEDAIVFLQDQWGLSASLRASGNGIVNGLGHWMVGGEQRGDEETFPGNPTFPDSGNVPFLETSGFPEPFASPGEKVDTMDSSRSWDCLHEWYIDALAYKQETLEIYCEGLDGRPITW